MSEITQTQQDKSLDSPKEMLYPIRVSPTEVKYMTSEELEASITEEDIKLGLSLAGAWSHLGMSEQELFRRLDEIRHGSPPSPPLVHSPE